MISNYVIGKMDAGAAFESETIVAGLRRQCAQSGFPRSLEIDRHGQVCYQPSSYTVALLQYSTYE